MIQYFVFRTNIGSGLVSANFNSPRAVNLYSLLFTHFNSHPPQVRSGPIIAHISSRPDKGGLIYESRKAF